MTPESRPTLSLCLVVRNEELLLAHALDGMREIVDECIVIDTGSTDRTIEIAKTAGATVFRRPWDGNLGGARNEYIERASGSWILVLDGDETIAAADRPKLRRLIEHADAASAYTFTVYDYSRQHDLLRNWHANRGAYPDEERRSGCPGRSEFDVVRLFRRAPGVRYDEGSSAHTNPIRSLTALGGEIRHADVVIHHFQWLKGGESFVAAKQRDRLSGEMRYAAANPSDCLTNLNVGRTLFALGRDQEALEYLTRAVEAERASAVARFNRGLVLCQCGRAADALVDFREALALKPDYADAWTLLGVAHHELGALDAAEQALQTALQCHPRHPLAYNSLGVVYLDLERWNDARDAFVQALAIVPDHSTATCNLASVYEQLGDLESARRVCRDALVRTPQSAELLQKLEELDADVT